MPLRQQWAAEADVTLTRHVSLRALQSIILHSFRWRFTEQLQVAERYRVAHRQVVRVLRVIEENGSKTAA